jgi:hypothetical protein
MTPKTLRKIPKNADLSHIHPDLRSLAVPVAALSGHPDNPRLHPDANRRAIANSLRKYLQRKPIVANLTDKGLRIEAGHGVYGELLAAGAQYVAVTIVEDDPVTELGFMLADNRSGDLSEDDPEKLAPIMKQLLEAGEDVEEIGWDDAAVTALLGEPDRSSGDGKPSDDEWSGALGGLPDGEKPPFQQMTFTLHDDQAQTVKEALERAKKMGEFVETGNENSNGNALARVCEMFLGANR